MSKTPPAEVTVRFEITATLVTLTPLHVGSGEVRPIRTVTGKEGTNRPPEVAAIVRDAMGRPYIPATTLKGLLKRLAEDGAGAAGTVVDSLFGTIKREVPTGSEDTESVGRMGALLMRGADRCGVPPDMRAAPFADTAPATADRTGTIETDAEALGPGVFVAARTRIDPASGTARDSTLFFQEMVAPKTTFTFRCLLDTRAATGTDAKAVLTPLLGLLDRLAVPEGVAVGKGQADGFGRLRLDPASVALTRVVLNPTTGRLESRKAQEMWTGRARSGAAPAPAASAITTRTLTLTCDGPFAILDASRTAKRAERAAAVEGNRDPQLFAQRLTDRLPLLLGSSLSGALRSRARWLEALRRHRGETAEPARGGPDANRLVVNRADIAKLTAEERLFGVTGFRGWLAIDSLSVPEAAPWDVTSVRLDRFSGAPIDNALFTTRTFLGVRIETTLALRPRAGLGPCPDDRALFDALMNDIRTNGLQLGHGGNKGFGWFTVKVTP